MRIGDRIRKFRREKDLTQEYIADKLGKTAAYVSMVENNKIDIDSEMIIQFAEVLGLSPVMFFADISPESLVPPGKDAPGTGSKGEPSAFYRLPGHLTEDERQRIQKFIDELVKIPEDRKDLVFNLIMSIFEGTKGR